MKEFDMFDPNMPGKMLYTYLEKYKADYLGEKFKEYALLNGKDDVKKIFFVGEIDSQQASAFFSSTKIKEPFRIKQVIVAEFLMWFISECQDKENFQRDLDVPIEADPEIPKYEVDTNFKHHLN